MPEKMGKKKPPSTSSKPSPRNSSIAETARKPTGKAKGSAISSSRNGSSPNPEKTEEPRAGRSAPQQTRQQQQQQLLDIFRRAFADVLAAEGFAGTLQRVKQALFERDFARAFVFDGEGGPLGKEGEGSEGEEKGERGGKEKEGDEEKPETEDFLSVYAARWSPTRALCYASLLHGLRDRLGALLYEVPPPPPPPGVDAATAATVGDGSLDEAGRATAIGEVAAEGEPKPKPKPKPRARRRARLKVVCLGGGAAEIAAFGAFLAHSLSSPLSSFPPPLSSPSASSSPLQPPPETAQPDPEGAPEANPETETETEVEGTITLADLAPWAPVVRRLHTGLTTPPPLSRYASAAARAASAPLLPASRLAADVRRLDVLSLDAAGAAELLRCDGGSSKPDDGDGDGDGDSHAHPVLITLFFTLNELFTAGGAGRTTALLLRLGAAAPPGSLLLVVDSPGSYSEASVGAQARRYPMRWLLDRILLSGGGGEKEGGRGKTEDGGGIRWEKLESDDSVWFRLPEGLDYPIPLENMRYQMHLYRAIASPTGDVPPPPSAP